MKFVKMMFVGVFFLSLLRSVLNIVWFLCVLMVCVVFLCVKIFDIFLIVMIELLFFVYFLRIVGDGGGVV